MKIIRVDNFNRDYVADLLIAESVDQHYGKIIVDMLNFKYSGPNEPYYFRFVNDDYKLWIFEP